MINKPIMLLNGLNFEVLKDIVDIYDITVGGHGSRYVSLSDLGQAIKSLQQFRSVEWRFGSKITCHSKLWLDAVLPPEPMVINYCVIQFRFDANIDVNLGENLEQAEKLKEEFENAAAAYLDGIDLLVRQTDA